MVEFQKPRLVPSGPAEQVQALFECFPERNRVALLGIFEWFVLFEGKVHPSECSPRVSCYLARGARGSCLKIALIYAQAQFQSFCFLVRVSAYQLPSSAGSSIFSSILLSTRMLRRIFSHFAFCFGCVLVGYPHRRAQSFFLLFCSRPVCLVKTTGGKP